MKHEEMQRPGGSATKFDDQPQSISRRRLLVGGAVAGAALAVGVVPSLQAAPAKEDGDEIRIGWITPRSGPLGLFDRLADPYLLKLVRDKYANGLKIGGKTYKVTIYDRDSQSSPSRASQLAQDLINTKHVHLMLTASTPEVVNPVSDACEAAGVPSIGTTVPLESFFFGRGGKPGHDEQFKWTYAFSFTVNSFVTCYLSAWDSLKTNKKIAVMYPNDTDGNAFREHAAPIYEKHGYKVIDPGAYTDGTTDYSSQIAIFKREKCQLFNTVPIPSDFYTFWRQAAQLHYLDEVVIAQMSKVCVFPSQMAPLGPLGYRLATSTPWSPIFPYSSPAVGLTSKQLGDGYEKATGHLWNQQVGQGMSLFDVGLAALKAAHNPLDRAAIRDAIGKLDMETTVGRVNFTAGPYPHTAQTVQIGAQWLKPRPGSHFPIRQVTVEHAEDPRVPIEAKLVPYAFGK